jgi:hypothetical protein
MPVDLTSGSSCKSDQSGRLLVKVTLRILRPNRQTGRILTGLKAVTLLGNDDTRR